MENLKTTVVLCCVVLLQSCVGSFRHIATNRADRFQGKVDQATAQKRGGGEAVKGTALPLVDWGNYYGTSDASPGGAPNSSLFASARRGIVCAHLVFTVERVGLAQFN